MLSIRWIANFSEAYNT